MSTFVGSFLVIVASTASSISFNFQKLAHRETNWEDPRTQTKLRKVPLQTPLYCRNYMILGFLLTVAATVCDAIALFFIGATMIGVVGCTAIPINVVVSRWLLKEEILIFQP